MWSADNLSLKTLRDCSLNIVISSYTAAGNEANQSGFGQAITEAQGWRGEITLTYQGELFWCKNLGVHHPEGWFLHFHCNAAHTNTIILRQASSLALCFICKCSACNNTNGLEPLQWNGEKQLQGSTLYRFNLTKEGVSARRPEDEDRNTHFVWVRARI